MDYSEVTLNEQHDCILHQITDIPLDEPLPHKVYENYFRFKRCCDKASIRVLEQDLARICVESGYGRERVEEPVSVIDLWRRKEASYDTPVVVQYRNKEVPGLLKHVTAAGEVVVQLEGDSEERKFKPEKVRVAELVS